VLLNPSDQRPDVLEMLGLVTLAARAFYILSSIAILTVRLIPVLRTRFLSYGARDQVAHTTRGRQQQQQQQQQQQLSLGIQLVDWASTFKVPHSWFGHFYAVSVATSIACAGLFHDRLDAPNGLCAFLMLVQGCRRLLECLSYSGSGTSRMWIGHYAIGLAFYVVTNIAIWTTGDVPPRDGSDLVGHDGVVWTLGNGRAAHISSISITGISPRSKSTPSQTSPRFDGS
jgi:3-oxo-5-alpha-steroid 4-dehydrogenase 3